MEITTTPKLVGITPGAIRKVREFTEKEGKLNAGLRLYVTGGGCSGLSYGLALEEQAGEDDLVIEEDGLKLFIDALSAKYVKGAVIDFVDALQGSGFKVNNPNVTSTCSCGSSFHAEAHG